MIRPGRNDLCWCGSGLKYKRCHSNFDDKLESMRLMHAVVPSHKLIKTPEQVAKIKESAKINIAVLDYVAEHIKAGITTEEIDRWVYDVTTKMGGIPAPLNYEGFPKSVCTSINNQVCHGIRPMMSCLGRVISSMWTVPQYLTDIFQTPQECSA